MSAVATVIIYNICALYLNLSAVHCSIDAQHYNILLVIVILFGCA